MSLQLKKQLVPLFLMLALGLSVTTTSYISVKKWERAQANDALERQAEAYVKSLRQSIFTLMNNMEGVRKLHEIEQSLPKDIFYTFLDHGLMKQGGIRAVDWVPKVPKAQHHDTEMKMRKNGIFDFTIHEYLNPLQAVASRDVYFPVLYTEPLDKNGHNMGVDLYSSTVFRKAMNMARDSGEFYTTKAIPIIGNTARRHQVRLFLPVYRGKAPLKLQTQRDKELRGFVSGLIYVDDLVESVLGDPEQSNNFHLTITETINKQTINPIYNSAWRLSAHQYDVSDDLPTWTANVLVGQKKWTMSFTRVEGSYETSFAPYIVVVLGLLTTSALMWYSWASQSHARRVEKLVSVRTNSLFKANRNLRKEIAERQKAEERLFYSAYHDTLTSCLNRRAFNDNLNRRFNEAKENGNWNFAVLFIDLDRLKYINDTFGHKAGDLIIVETSERIEHMVRAGDRMARLGGDEFAVILEQVDDLKRAEDVAGRILTALRVPFNINMETFTTSGSIGVALAHDLYKHPEDILRDSDTAMYHAKNSGRNQHAVFTIDMYHKAMRDIRMQSDLHAALGNDEFHLVFQPIIDMKSNKLFGFEALIRWQHPSIGLIPPDEFIPLTEELGLIGDIGHWVINKALSTLHRLQTVLGLKDLSMNINVSPLQVLQPNLVQKLSTALKEHQIKPAFCRIEITETALGTSAEEMAGHLKRLKKLGVKILIDDFGTGHASLSHLSLFPIDGLKIDRSFVTDMEHNKTKKEIVRTIVSLKKILNLQVTAEGIETFQQNQILKSMGCDHSQGYFIGRPMSEQDVESYILRNRQTDQSQSDASPDLSLLKTAPSVP